MKNEKSIFGKYKQSFEIEYELKQPDLLYSDDCTKMTIDLQVNKKHLRAYKKGIKLTAKYLARMKRLGFTLVEQETGENKKDENRKRGEWIYTEYDTMPRCSECGYLGLSAFCPNCGAYMDEESEDTE